MSIRMQSAAKRVGDEDQLGAGFAATPNHVCGDSSNQNNRLSALKARHCQNWSMRALALTAVAVLLACQPARAEQVVLTAPVTAFTPSSLGGIRTVVRYAVPRPDRSEIDYLLLGEPSGDAAGSPPTAIQVEGPHGDQATLSDIDGADCILARTAIIRSGHGVVLISATRTDSTKQVLAGSLSGPGVMDIWVYRSRAGGEPGESSPVFTADPTPARTKPMCSGADVQQAVETTAQTILGSRAGQ